MERPLCRALLRALVAGLLFVATSRTDGQVQEPARVWGEIPIDDLKTTAYPADSNANAVILFDYGTTRVNQDFDLVFKRHRRIKILSTEGYEWATATVSYYAEDNTERISDIEGATYTLAPDGQVVKQELDDNSIYTEEYDRDWKRTKFTLPGLSPGCVIEYRYTVTSTNPVYLEGWVFQTTEPVLWTEYDIKIPRYYVYASVIQGYQPFAIESSEHTKETFMIGSGSRIVDMVHSRWAMRNVPALREAPYMTTLDDYRARISFQLAMLNWPGGIPQMFLESWDKVAEELRDHGSFGQQLELNGNVRKQGEDIARAYADSMGKLNAIYDFLRTTIVWDGQNHAFAHRTLDEVLKSRSGSSSEINLMLTLMLREAGLAADPVLLSTRSNGKIQDEYPMLSQFNYVICRAGAGGKTLLLDATDRLRPAGLLPVRALNHRGFLVGKDRQSMIDIEPGAKTRSATLATVHLGSNGALSGRIEFSFTDYSALNERRRLTEKKDDEYVKTLLKTETSGLTVDSFSIRNRDSVSVPFGVEANVSAPSYAQVAGNVLYVNPVTVAQIGTNPFKEERRLVPIDFAYPFSTTYSVNLTIPSGYIVKECPRDLSLLLPAGSGKYTRQSQVADTTVQLVMRFDLLKTAFEPPQYKALRAFYEEIVGAEAERIILEKRHPASASSAKPKR